MVLHGLGNIVEYHRSPRHLRSMLDGTTNFQRIGWYRTEGAEFACPSRVPGPHVAVLRKSPQEMLEEVD